MISMDHGKRKTIEVSFELARVSTHKELSKLRIF